MGIFVTVFASLGGILGFMVGGVDTTVRVFLIVMALDYFTGIMVAGVFHNSSKTNTGSLSSSVGWKGLVKKIISFICVILAYQIDTILETEVVREGVLFAFIANETVSILENAGLMGIPFPDIITNAIDVLKKGKGGDHGV